MKTANWMIRLATSTALSTIGWWLGVKISIFTAYMFSTVAGGYGIYLGGRIARQLF